MVMSELVQGVLKGDERISSGCVSLSKTQKHQIV